MLLKVLKLEIANKNNYGCTKRIVQFCKHKNIKLIFPSSTSVYGKKFNIINSTNNMKNLFAQILMQVKNTRRKIYKTEFKNSQF